MKKTKFDFKFYQLYYYLCKYIKGHPENICILQQIY